MTDSKYFTTTKKGEIFELKAELNSEKKEKKKEAVKKVIASMTVGKDVSALFPDVVNCMQTDNLELKKLVYLYLMNYAKSQPDMAIMAVNTFVKDCEDSNPLIRALAVRTMGCIRVARIAEYACEPLRRCLRDEDPYVRKTAAVCVAKLHDLSPSLVLEQGFLDSLKDLLSDSNPMVVSNAVAALCEIAESRENDPEPLLDLTPALVNKLLTALNECNEWGQIFLLDCLANYNPADAREAQSVCERVSPRLAHANPAVVLSAVKVLLGFANRLEDQDALETLLKKLAPPLVTLLASEPELQYVALRNINLIVQRRPSILRQEMRVFFVRYNDPIYVKLEKLDIMVRLASSANISQVLAELREYAAEVDVDFVRRAVCAIGRCAIKVEQCAERCISLLLDLMQSKVSYVLQEAVVVIKDIFRKYPSKYESILSVLCDSLESLDEPESRASMLWIIGENAERVENATEILTAFLEGFHDEMPQVQLQLLSAIVKLFLKKPAETQTLVQQVLSLATQDSDNPDLRDRGYIYWRLLSTDPAAARDVVLAEKPLISEECDMLERSLLDSLISQIATLSSIYHKPPHAFLEGVRAPGVTPVSTRGESVGIGSDTPQISTPAEPQVAAPPASLLGDLLNLDLCPTPASTTTVQPMGMLNLMGTDLLGGGPNLPPAPQLPTVPSGALADLFDLGGGSIPAITSPKLVWLTALKGKGLEVKGTFSRRQGSPCMELSLSNHAMAPLAGFALQLNHNSFGLAPTCPLSLAAPLLPGQCQEVNLPLAAGGMVMQTEPLTALQVAIKNNIDVFYFGCTIPLHVLFIEDAKMDPMSFNAAWTELTAETEVHYQLQIPLPDGAASKLATGGVFVSSQQQEGGAVGVPGMEVLRVCSHLISGVWILAEIRGQPGIPPLMVQVRTRVPKLAPPAFHSYETLLCSY
uniref:AP-1 complex subunit beta-1-like isoform X1 n=2 Tax=Myxine glutinosa TaxID=7769 RepID=UPI00358F5E58